jgi:hypothetical protein
MLHKGSPCLVPTIVADPGDVFFLCYHGLYICFYKLAVCMLKVGASSCKRESSCGVLGCAL